MSPKQHGKSCEKEGDTPDDTLIREFKRVWKDKIKAGASEDDVYDEFLQHVRTQDSKLQYLLKLHISMPESVPFWKSKCCWFLIFPIVVTSIISGLLFILSTHYQIDPYDLYYDAVHGTPCLLDNNQLLNEITRPVFQCKACEGLESVPIEYDINEEDFLKKYAYTGVPALIKGATTEWNALETFSFHYFQKLYKNHIDAFYVTEHSCQFFPYNTEFDTLEAAFNMSDARATYEEGEKPWYFGWYVI